MQPSITTPLLREVINLDIHPSRQAEEALNNRVDAWITELFDVSVGNAVTADAHRRVALEAAEVTIGKAEFYPLINGVARLVLRNCSETRQKEK